MRVKIGRVTLQFPKEVLSEYYKPINEPEEVLLGWIKKVLNADDVEIINENNIDINKLIEGKRKKTLDNIIKVCNYIEKRYYVNQKPINFLEVAYKTGLSLSTIKRYLKGILKDKEIVTIPKDELIELIEYNLFGQ